MSLVFVKNSAPRSSFEGKACSICSRGFSDHKDTTSHRIRNVYHTVHLECLLDRVKNQQTCPICKRMISSLKEREFPKAHDIVFTVMVVSAAIFLIGGCCFPERTPKMTLGAMVVMMAALVGLGVIERKEGTTFYQDPDHSILDDM